MKKVMIIGAVGAGKSTLIKALFGEQPFATKTQSLVYRDWVIDTPGEYTENPLFYRSLMATAHEAVAVVLVHDASRQRNYFPPGFAGGFPVPALGVITKIDHPQADVKRAEALLRQALPSGQLFYTSATGDLGMNELRQRLHQLVFAG